MGVAIASIDLEFFEHRVTERALGKHSLDRNLQGAAWKPLLHLAKGCLGDAARVAGVPKVLFVFSFIARDTDFLSVNHHNKITGVHMGREFCLVLAAQVVGKGCREPA